MIIALVCIRAGQGSFICCDNPRDRPKGTKRARESRTNVPYSPATSVDLEELRSAWIPAGASLATRDRQPLINPVNHCGDLLDLEHQGDRGAPTWHVGQLVDVVT